MFPISEQMVSAFDYAQRCDVLALVGGLFALVTGIYAIVRGGWLAVVGGWKVGRLAWHVTGRLVKGDRLICERFEVVVPRDGLSGAILEDGARLGSLLSPREFGRVMRAAQTRKQGIERAAAEVVVARTVDRLRGKETA